MRPPALLPAVLLLALVSLGACTVGPNYRPAAPTALGVPDAYSVADGTRAPDTGHLATWWRGFDDPVLIEIVEQARADNLDIAQAVARLRQAREQLVQSRAQLVPNVGASAGYSRSQSIVGGTTTLPGGATIVTGRGSGDTLSLGADVQYQVGLFGEVRRTVEASRAQLEASGYDSASVLISVEAEVARNYILARLYQAQLSIARDSLRLQDDNLEIAGFRVQAGLVSSLDSEQARSQRAQTAATVPALEQNYNAAVSRLGVLTGQAPGALKGRMADKRPVPVERVAIATGIPADTLRQRPDVRAAERNLAAATAQIGVAKAQLYPALAISGSISTDASKLGNLFETIAGQVFAGLTQSIFNGGRLRSQVRGAEAAADGAFAAYKATVLGGLEDVENALAALDSARQRRAEFAIAEEAANNAAILSRSQYRSGLTDSTTLNNAEATLLSARNGLVQSYADRSGALVQLYLALGGGWDSAADPTLVPPRVPPTPVQVR